MSEPLRQGAAGFRPLVAFDFDGTLTYRDSFLAFLFWLAGPWRFWSGLLKEAFVTRYLGGASRRDVEKAARAFATECSASLLRPDALRRWREWRDRGARLLIVTASPEIIVAPFAHGLGAEALIATRLAFDADDRVAGTLAGPNCRGAEKVARLRAMFGEDVRLEAAYGDSDGDVEMLALADEAGMKVFGERP